MGVTVETSSLYNDSNKDTTVASDSKSNGTNNKVRVSFVRNVYRNASAAASHQLKVDSITSNIRRVGSLIHSVLYP